MKTSVIVIGTIDLAAYILLLSVDWRIALAVFLILCCNFVDHNLNKH